jgi:CheY-like chemotaxis protein
MHTEWPLAILLIENDADIRALLLTVLRELDFTVHAFDGGKEAVDWYCQHHAETGLVILEVNMSPIDGAHALALLRFMNPKLPAIFLTGGLNQSVAEQLLALGGTQMLMKPFSSLDHLAAAIRKGLKGVEPPPLAPPRDPSGMARIRLPSEKKST